MVKKGYFEGPGDSRTFVLPLVLIRAIDREASNGDDPQLKSELVFEALCTHLKLDKAVVLQQNSELLKQEVQA